MTGRMYPEGDLETEPLVTTFIGFILTFFPQFICLAIWECRVAITPTHLSSRC